MEKNIKYLVIIVLYFMINIFAIESQNFNYIKYSNHNIEISDKYKEGNDYQKDLLLFTTLLAETHPAFAFENQQLFNIDSISNAGYKWAAQCKTVDELASYLQGICSLLQDGHTSVLPDFNYNMLYPFNFFMDSQNVYLTMIDNDFKMSLGKQIIEINNKPVNEVFNSFKEEFCNDNEIGFMEDLKNKIQFYTLWKNNPYRSKDSLLTLTFSDKSSISLKPISQKNIYWAFYQSQNRQNTIRESSRQPFLYKILQNEDICYLQFNECKDQSSLRYDYLMGQTFGLTESEFEQKVSQFPRFDEFLNTMFQEIVKKNIKTLVIDVRDNTGGNSMLCDVLLSWLKPVNEIKQGSSGLRISELWKQTYPQLASKYEEIFRENNENLIMGKMYDPAYISTLTKQNMETSIDKKINDLFVKNIDENKVFKGQVFFIQNMKTYSSAGLLIRDAVDNQIGTLLGSKSSYKPCSYGDLLAWELPNTHIKGFISHKIFYRPDKEKCNEISIIPEFFLPLKWSDYKDGNDLDWKWILENYDKRTYIE